VHAFNSDSELVDIGLDHFGHDIALRACRHPIGVKRLPERLFPRSTRTRARDARRANSGFFGPIRARESGAG
jgi:hypothetical protein